MCINCETQANQPLPVLERFTTQDQTVGACIVNERVFVDLENLVVRFSAMLIQDEDRVDPKVTEGAKGVLALMFQQEKALKALAEEQKDQTPESSTGYGMYL